MKNIAALVAAILLLTGCARDIILKPAASSFVADARSAVTQVDTLYTGVIGDMNERNAKLLADNPGCGLNTRLVLRTDIANAILRRAGRTTDGSLCLSADEIEAIDASGAPDARVALSTTKRLLILSPTDFMLRTAVVQQLTDYVALLADAMDDPKLTAADEIKDVASGVLALGQSAGDLRNAFTGTTDSKLSKLFAASGPVDKFAGGLAELGGAIELIADQAHDVKTIERAVLGKGPDISRMVRNLAGDADQWACIRADVVRGQQMEEAASLGAGFAGLPDDRRLAAARTYLAAAATAPDPRCGIANPPPFSAVGKMLDALADANDDLTRIARGDLTPAERRREAAETMRRLGAVFKAIASVGAVLL